MTWSVGDRVFHRIKSEWGLGEVDALGDDGRMDVYFEKVGKKLLKDPPLLWASGADVQRPLVREVGMPKRRGKKVK
jgi:hypothetical protein